MKKLRMPLGLTIVCLFCANVSLLAQKIVGNAKVCPGVETIYYFDPETVKDHCKINLIGALDWNGNRPPTRVINDYTIAVTWPAGNGIGTVKAEGAACCLLWCERKASLNVFVGPGKPISMTGNGSDFFCPGQTLTYTLQPAFNKGDSYKWEVPSGWLVNNQVSPVTTTSLSANITAPSTGSGSFQLTVRAIGCNNTSVSPPLTKTVNVGLFNDFYITGPSCLCCATTYTLSVPNIYAATYEWQISVNDGPLVNYGGSNAYPYVPDPYTSLEAYVRVNTGCGWSEWKYFYASRCADSQFNQVNSSRVSTDGDTTSDALITVSPNSASAFVSVKTPGSLRLESVDIYSHDGRFIKKVKNDGDNSVELSVENMNNGLYVLKLHTSEGIKLKRVLVEK